MSLFHFKEQQEKLVKFHSKEFKEAEAKRLKEQELQYWEDYNWMIDRAYDGSDEQPYEPEETNKEESDDSED